MLSPASARMRRSVTVSTSRSPRGRCWPRCFTPRRSRAAGWTVARGWLGRSEFSQPAEILRDAGAQIALEELSGVGRAGRWGLPHLGAGDCAGRARVGVPCGGPGTAQTPALTPQIDLGELIAQRGTLYVISPSRIQQELAPLIAAVLDGSVRAARSTSRSPHPSGRLERPLLLALDEVANIAPIRSLPRLLSEGIQQGIVPVLGVQDMSQARARWGEHETATMWSTPALRLVLAGVADPYTAQLVSDACGEQLVWRAQVGENTSTSHQVERARHGPTPAGTATPMCSSASARSTPRTSARCRPAARSRYPRAASRSRSTCSPARPASPTATGPRSLALAASGYASHSDGGGPPANRAAVGSPVWVSWRSRSSSRSWKRSSARGSVLSPASSWERQAPSAPRTSMSCRSVHQSATSFEKTRG